MIIFGEHLTTQNDFEAYEYFITKLLNQYDYLDKNWNGYNILHTAASRVGGLDIGFIANNAGMDTEQILQKCEIIILLGADEIDLKRINPKAYIVYIGHHGDKVAEIADIILPAPAFTEKNSTYVNLEGRVQNTYATIDPLGEAKIDWEIILELAKLTDIELPYSNLNEIRDIKCKTNSVFKNTGNLIRNDLIKNPLKQKNFTKDIFDNEPLNYYLANSICRNSITMRKCSQL
jgi:NADH-quinone oxidoreductase subunit G